VVKQSVVIVGAGIIGCAIARELARRGVACTIVDPRPVAGGATQASAGMLAPYVEADAGGPMLDLCVRSLDRYDDWIAGLREEGASIEYRRIPTLEIALSPAQAAALGGGHGEWLSPRDVARAIPELAPVAGARRNDRHGYVDARELAQALAESSARHGAAFVDGRVERIDHRGATLAVDLGPGRDPVGADAVVLAAGAWSNRINGVRTPPLRPVRGQLLLHRGELASGERPARLPAILWGPGCYIVPRDRSSQLLIGATVEDAGFDERPTEAARTSLFDAACRLLPLAADGVEETRVGLRPVTPDQLPALGDDPSEPGVFHAAGHYRNGILLAPITAMLMADLIVDGRRDPCLDSFRPHRFSRSD
jgi:glycine oxidase ThiO